MNITLSDTNVIVLYGDGAVSHFADLINRWNGMLSYNQWDRLQFILAAGEMPKFQLEEPASQRVNSNNTRFFRIQEEGPNESVYYGLVYNKVKTGTLRLHLICDAGERELSYDWAKTLIQSASMIGTLTTHCYYYFHFGRNSSIGENEQIIQLLKTQEGTTFLLGDSDELGGYIRPEERWYATELAVLLNCAGRLSVSRGAYSLGYSSLNASGSELRRICESAGCQALQEILGKQVTTMSEAGMSVPLLMDGLDSLKGMREWLRAIAKERVPAPKPSALRNAWVTIRMNRNLPATEAVRRMKRFADLNYAGNRTVQEIAGELAGETERTVRGRLRYSVATAGFSPQVFQEIAAELHGIASMNPEPNGCTYPKPPLLVKLGKGIPEYEEQCKAQIMSSIRDYILEKNLCVFARELEQAYLRLADWVAATKEISLHRRGKETALELLQDIRKELDDREKGNVIQLKMKYRAYAEALEAIRPPLSDLTENAETEYFDEQGNPIEKAWRQLVHQAGKNMEKRLPEQFRGDFFRVLNGEFSTKEEREKFFEEYLRSGKRMYMHLKVMPGQGVPVLLADERLTDSWFTKQNIYQTRTDNAENLTLYPLSMEAAELLKDTTAYFRGKDAVSRGTGGIDIFAETKTQKERPAPTALPEQNLFETPAEQETRNAFSGAVSDVHMEPDAKNEYRLYWPWKGNDATAMVELFQNGEKVGRVAVIPVLKFRQNGDNLYVTEEIMGGRSVPAGTLTVTIRDAKNAIYVEGAAVSGRRDVVRYRMNNQMLRLRPDMNSSMAKLVLRSTDTDGTQTYYPLYPAAEGDMWRYEGLQINDGRIVTDPTQPAGPIYAINVEE